MNRRIAKKIRKRYQRLYDFIKALEHARYDREDAPHMQEFMRGVLAGVRGDSEPPPEPLPEKKPRPWPKPYRGGQLRYSRATLRRVSRHLTMDERCDWHIDDLVYRDTLEKWRDPWGHTLKMTKALPGLIVSMSEHFAKDAA